MADKEHFELLMRDVNAWNGWRAENPKEKPDLSFAVMRGADDARGPRARQYLRRGSFDRRGSDRGATPAHARRCADQAAGGLARAGQLAPEGSHRRAVGRSLALLVGQTPGRRHRR